MQDCNGQVDTVVDPPLIYVDGMRSYNGFTGRLLRAFAAVPIDAANDLDRWCGAARPDDPTDR